MCRRYSSHYACGHSDVDEQWTYCQHSFEDGHRMSTHCRRDPGPCRDCFEATRANERAARAERERHELARDADEMEQRVAAQLRRERERERERERAREAAEYARRPALARSRTMVHVRSHRGGRGDDDIDVHTCADNTGGWRRLHVRARFGGRR